MEDYPNADPETVSLYFERAQELVTDPTVKSPGGVHFLNDM